MLQLIQSEIDRSIEDRLEKNQTFNFGGDFNLFIKLFIFFLNLRYAAILNASLTICVVSHRKQTQTLLIVELKELVAKTRRRLCWYHQLFKKDCGYWSDGELESQEE